MILFTKDFFIANDITSKKGSFTKFALEVFLWQCIIVYSARITFLTLPEIALCE